MRKREGREETTDFTDNKREEKGGYYFSISFRMASIVPVGLCLWLFVMTAKASQRPELVRQ